MTFEELLSRAAEPTLQRMVGRNGVRLLTRLDPALAQPERLREVALGLRSAQEMLLDPEIRAELLDLMPPAEAQQLLMTLGVGPDGDAYAALRELRVQRGSSRQTKLLD